MAIPHKNDLSQRVPAYLAKAIKSGSKGKTEKAIDRAVRAGFTIEQLNAGVNRMVDAYKKKMTSNCHNET